MTNAEKLRVMSDEELAHALLKLDGFDTFCVNFAECVEKMNHGVDVPQSQCEECMLRWLRRESISGSRPEWQNRMLRVFGGDADA